MEAPFEALVDAVHEPLVYRLAGVDVNPFSLDSREAFDQTVVEFVTGGMDPERAEVRAYELRLEIRGLGPEHGFTGEPVSYGFPCNLDMLVAPLSDDQIDVFIERWMLDPLQVLDRIVYALLVRSAVVNGDKSPHDVQTGPEGGLSIPRHGELFGTPEENADALVASLLWVHGKVVGTRANGDFILEPVPYEAVKEEIPGGFAFKARDNGITVLEEVLRGTALWERWNGGILVLTAGLPVEDVTDTFRGLIAGGPVRA